MRRPVGIVIGSVVGLAMLAGCAGPAGHHAAGPTGPTVSTRSAVAVTSAHPVPPQVATTRATTVPVARSTDRVPALRSWRSRVISDGPAGGFSSGSLIATGGSVYALSTTSVERIAPTSGAVTARASYVGPPGVTLALVGRQLWLPSVEHGDLVVERYTLALTSLPTVTVSGGEPAGFYPVSVTRDAGPYFYLSDATHLYSVDTRTAATKTISAVPKDIAALALPTGSSEDVIATIQSPSGLGGGEVDTLSPTGEVLRVDRRFARPGSRSAPTGSPSGGPGALAATSTGIWVEVSTGMAAQFEFIRPGSTSMPRSYGVPSPSTMTVTGRNSWVGLLGTLTCLSSTSGRTLASTHVDGSQSSVGAVASGDGHTYALWRAGGRISLIQFVAPKSCLGP